MLDLKSGFNIDYKSNYKIVTNELANKRYGLHCGDEPPDAAKEYELVDRWFKLPLSSVGVRDLGIIPFIQLSNHTESIEATLYPEQVTSPCVVNNNLATLSPDNADQYDAVFSTVPFGNGTFSNTTTIIVSIGNHLDPLQNVEWLKFVS
ncbi:hypothetical protein EV182_002886, partial [Spiromyces aspiralis]